MGKDIHMFLMDNDIVVKSEIFSGRDSEWFDNISRRGGDFEYDYFPSKPGWFENEPTLLPEELMEFTKDNGYFDFYRVKVKDFVDWFIKYKPYKEAGWASKYDIWRMKEKCYIPAFLPHEKPNDGEEYEFIEYIKSYDCSNWLYNYIYDYEAKTRSHINNYTIIYCFDR